MPFVFFIIALIVVSAPVSADYLTDRPALRPGVQLKIDELMVRIDTLASSNPQKIYPRIKNLLKTKLARMKIGKMRYDIMSEITYQVSVRDGIVNRTFTPYGTDRFLHDPENFIVKDVTEKYFESESGGNIWSLCFSKNPKICTFAFEIFDQSKKESILKNIIHHDMRGLSNGYNYSFVFSGVYRGYPINVYDYLYDIQIMEIQTKNILMIDYGQFVFWKNIDYKKSLHQNGEGFPNY